MPSNLPRPPAAAYRQRGLSIIIVLMVLIVIGIIGLSASQLGTRGEVASRNDRDYRIAMQWAEAALEDAKRNISCTNAGNPTFGIPTNLAEGVGPNQDTPAWRRYNLISEDSQYIQTIGINTGRSAAYQGGKTEGIQPAQLPRYIIETVPYDHGESSTPNSNATAPDTLALNGFSRPYLITAIGYGPRKTTNVIIQATYIALPTQSAGHKNLCGNS